jgi:membrane associated rhomboid family serine protease
MQFGPPLTPSIVKQLMIINAVVFFAQTAFQHSFDPEFSVIPGAVWQAGYLWQPFTYMWLHGGFWHIAMNMFVLWMFGSPLAMAWGPKRFLRYYLICGIGAGFIIASYPYILYAFGGSPANLITRTLGASGAVYGLVLAYSLTWPERTIMLIFPPVAFKAIWLIPAMFFMTLMSPGAGNVSHLGHLGGVLVGWILLRKEGRTGNLFSIEQLKYRWRRHRMKQKLRSVQYEDFESQRRRNNNRDDDNDRRYH